MDYPRQAMYIKFAGTHDEYNVPGIPIILEEMHHALDSGAHIYCELSGYGASSEAYHIAAPDPEPEMQARAMKDAMKSAGAAPEEIEYINAHGTSTALNDPVEPSPSKKRLATPPKTSPSVPPNP